VRHSLGHPRAYAKSNLTGFLEVLEFARNLPACRHLVYASSSSVYGASAALPFRVGDRVDQPVSLYAATKQANELMAATYSHLYRLPCTGLRYFTVYGPWGRPDMAPHLFTRAILTGQPIRLFNAGDMRRDFTYIDDVVRATIGCLDRPPLAQSAAPAHRVYNVGNHRSEALGDFVAALERACGRRAVIEPTPMQPGDVRDTFADIEDTKRDLAWQPTVSIKVGIPRFVAWFRDYYSL
jgi:UDP-glucuronate 4-epimerase